MAENADTWELLKKIEGLREELTGVREVLNNGIVKATLENSEAIKKLALRITELEKKISNDDAEETGKKTMLKIIIGVVSGMGSGAITVLSVLKYLGVI